MAEARHVLGAAAAALVLAAGAGCAALPSSGSVHVGRALQPVGEDADLRVKPPAPFPGMHPDQVVNGFLQAMVSPQAGYAVAREYLTSRAESRWSAAGNVVIYDDNTLQLVPSAATGNARDFVAHASMLGVRDARGDFTPQAGDLDLHYTLVRDGGDWRLDQLPQGLYLAASDASLVYQRYQVYYLADSTARLVPEQLLLSGPETGLATALVRALFAGPSAWLAPAVRTAVPPGVRLLGNVPVDGHGVADVDLQGPIQQAPSRQLQELSAQLAWTLRQLAAVTSVQLSADGSPLAVPGFGARVPTTSWASLSPTPAPSVSGALVVNDGRVTVSGAAAPAGFADSVKAAGWDAMAMSADGRQLAGVQDGHTIVTGAVGHRLVPQVSAASVTAPAFDPGGNVYAVLASNTSRTVVEVTPTGQIHDVVAPQLVGQPVQELQISRDGSRVAAVVGSPGDGRLLVGRVTIAGGVVSWNGFRDVLLEYHDVRGVTWQSGDTLVSTVALNLARSPVRALVQVDVDGYDAEVEPTPSATDPTDVTAAPGQPLLLLAGGGLWEQVGAAWRLRLPAQDAAYPG